MSTLKISMSDEMRAWVEGEMRANGYSDISEYINALVSEAQAREEARHLLEQQSDHEPDDAQSEPPLWWDEPYSEHSPPYTA